MISPEQVRPTIHGKSDFFNWNLYLYLKKFPSPLEHRIWAGTWDSITGHDAGKRILYIGCVRDGDWIHAQKLRNLCAPKHKIHRLAYGRAHYTHEWEDVTEAFWAEYQQKGVCAIHGDYAHKFVESGDRSVCQYCGAEKH